VNYDNSLVVTITVTCYPWAPSSGDDLFTCGAIFWPPHNLRIFFDLPTARLGMLSSVYKWRLFFIASHPVFAVSNTNTIQLKWAKVGGAQ